MKRILTKAEIRQKEINRLSSMVICDTPKKSPHCLKQCKHGTLHEKEIGNDACHIHPEFCSLSKSGIRKVVCKKLTQKQIQEILNDSK